MRRNYSSGEEIRYQDLNATSSMLEKQFYERILYKLMQQRSNAFFDEDFKVIWTGTGSAYVKAGLGMQLVAGPDLLEPLNRPLYLAANSNVFFSDGDATHPRIDLVCVKAARVNSETDPRRFKDENSGAITTNNVTITTDWEAEVYKVAGTPAASPVVPATPSGYVAIAEVLVSAVTGIADQAAITDKRILLPKASSVKGSGNLAYDMVVGDLSEIGVTHTSLVTAVNECLGGERILVTKSEALSATVLLDVPNLEIVFTKDAQLTKASATIAIQIDADNCTIRQANLSGFNGVSDVAIKISATADSTYLENPVFTSCTLYTQDLGTNSSILVRSALTAGCPIGSIMPWVGGYFGDGSNGSFTNVLANTVANLNTLLNYSGWFVCDGSALNDAASPIFNAAGRYLPNLTDERFLQGNTTAGGIGGSNTLLDHTHSHSLTVAAHTHTFSGTVAATSHSHGHTLGTSSDGSHTHTIPSDYSTGGSAPYNWQTVGTSYYTRSTTNLTTPVAGAHTHSITGTVSSESAHTHTYSGTTSGASASSISGTVGTGAAVASTNARPKYLNVFYIIKAK